jgi:hypothetical protein
MVPSDGKFFLTNDLLRGAPATPVVAEPADEADDPPQPIRTRQRLPRQ